MATVGQKGAVKTGRSKFSTVPIGSVAYGSMGTNTSTVAGTMFYADINLSRPTSLTGIGVLNGATVGTDKGIVVLFDSTGAPLAWSATAGATTSGANAFQQYAFTAVTATLQPGQYFVGYQSNGTTDTIRTVAASTFVDLVGSSATGTFATIPSITPPTTLTADKAPIAYAYA